MLIIIDLFRDLKAKKKKKKKKTVYYKNSFFIYKIIYLPLILSHVYILLTQFSKVVYIYIYICILTLLFSFCVMFSADIWHR